MFQADISSLLKRMAFIGKKITDGTGVKRVAKTLYEKSKLQKLVFYAVFNSSSQ